MVRIKITSLFSGIGAFEQALTNIGVDYDVVNFCEIDKYAIKSYCELHGVDDGLNLGDISKVDKLQDCDLLTYGFPCQSVSVAGRMEGLTKGSGTRSGLLWEVERLLENSNRPKYLIMENVKNLVGKQFKDDFYKWLTRLEELGYNNYWKVLNSKNFGVPQNRERVFCISIRKDVDLVGYEFPIGFSNGNIITYTLQKQVRKRKNECNLDELKLLLKTSKDISNLTIKNISEILNVKKTLVEHWFRSDSCFSIPDEINWFKLKKLLNITQSNYDKFITEFEVLDGVYEKANRIYDSNGLCPTLTTSDIPTIIEFEFPNPTESNVALKDILEQFVDEKYYLSEKVQQRFQFKPKGDNIIGTTAPDFRTIGQRDLVFNPDKIMGTLVATDYKQPKQIIEMDVKRLPVICEQRSDEGLRFFKSDICGTLRTIDSCGDKRIIEENFRIRKLTPIECWRLQGFNDDSFDKVKALGISDSQLYKQAGNSITVNVLEEIFKNLLK